MSTEITTTTSPEVDAAAEAFAIQRQIIDALDRGRRALWSLAEGFYEFDERQGWLALGYENLTEWLAQPEICTTRGSYYRYVRTWRKLVVERQIPAERLKELDQAKVAIVTDVIVEAKVPLEEALSDVEALAARDLREKYYGRREQPGQNPGSTEGSGRVLEDTEEPVRGDEVSSPEFVNVILTTEPLVEEIVVAENDDPEAEAVITVSVVEPYEYPGWVTEGAVNKMVQGFNYAIGEGASFPRVDRSDLQVAIELAKAWLATRQS